MLIFEDEFDKATTEYNEDQEKLESLSKTQNTNTLNKNTNTLNTKHGKYRIQTH